MVKKAALVFGFTLLFLLAITAVWVVRGRQGSSPGGTAGPVTLSFWHSMTDDAGLAFDTFVREFNAGPGAARQITVEAVFQGQYADATAKLRPLLQTGQRNSLPDVMQIDATGIVDYLNTEYAFTVDDALAIDRSYDIGQIMEAPLKAWNYGGKQLGLPVSASTTVMYYNKTILDAAGITSPPTSFQEIIEAARRLPSTNLNNQKLTAFAQQPNTPLLANWIGQIPGRDTGASYLVNNRNGRDGDATTLVANTEGTLLAFLRAWKAMYEGGALLNVSDGLNNLFLTQQIVFLTASTSMLTSLLNQIDGRFELGCTFFPRVNSAANYGAAVSGSALFMFNKGDSAKTQAAWEFVKFMCSADIQARFSAATGYTPVNIGSANERAYIDYIALYPQAMTGTKQLAETSADMMGVIVGPSRNFYYEIVNQVSFMLTENKTPEETVSTMARALNLLLDDYAEANR
ncbi:MAG: extracellular solute-binding protein [Treponema sp.]|jgi:sn-glycerol 3-phosphate transport system substrate-binding protein|nr:extracellular solute-binding protein [Treponema sp.]